MQDQQQNRPKRAPRLNLPFEKRKEDPASWIFRHRAAILLSLIVYIAIAIAFVSSKLVINSRSGYSEIMVDFDQLDRLQQELQRAQELNRLLNEQRTDESYEDVVNQISNQNADLNENLRDDRGTDAGKIYNEADEVQQRMRANRESYEAGLKEQQQPKSTDKSGNDNGGKSSRVAGKVTGAYSLSDPIRNAVRFIVPSYRCEGGGTVVVNIEVDRNGKVVGAEVDSAFSTSDYCMTTCALEAARSSLFNVDLSAPARQQGTITYKFVPQ